MNQRKPIDAIFFDRDGIINEVVMRDGIVSSPRCSAEFRIVPDFVDLHAALRRHAVRMFVVSNQPDVSRELLPANELRQMDEELHRLFGFDEIVYCTHDDSHGCECRKPRPGMIISLLQKYELQPERVIFVGDSKKDVLAGRAARVPTVLLKRPYNAEIEAEFTVDTLREILDLVTFAEEST